MDSMKSEKKMLRNKILAVRDALSEEVRIRAEQKLLDEITALDLFRTSDNILLFASYGSEIRTDDLINECLLLGKRVFLPKVIGKEILFYRISALDELDINGYKGIREPFGDTEEFEDNYSKSMMIMPGAVFDKEGYRLGYGGGFYDRFLADKEILAERSIAIGYKVQEADLLPHEEFDIKPGRIMLF